MDIGSLNLEFQLSLAEKLAGLPSSKIFPVNPSSYIPAPLPTKFLAPNLPQKLVETQICMLEKDLDALESIAQLQQRDSTILRLEAKIIKLQDALATSQRATAQIQSKIKAFPGLAPQDVNTLRPENDSLKTRFGTSDGNSARGQQSSFLELENSNLNQHNAIEDRKGFNSGALFTDDIMALQKELAAALLRVRDRELQCKKYKEAIRTLKSRLEEEEEKRRNEAESKASAAVAESETAVARQQQVKEEAREAVVAAVRLAKRRAMDAENKVTQLESDLSELQKLQRLEKQNNPLKATNLKTKATLKNEKKESVDHLQQALLQERALTSQLREQLLQEKTQRTHQEGILELKIKALAEVEKRQKQLDGIIKRLAQQRESNTRS